ncbi:hypothetical protein [Polluticoccus soli]|uniref:hypothetical protein n=1 Tax=Polluticoccus soli TaxID=3034150 RepID=UPI0023E2D634|nr:hypothetical protein [Flavipsychrobacter sp. JY13-12]
MKSIKTLMLLGAFGLFAASCGESTENETTVTDTATAVPVTPVDTVAGGTMDAATTTGGVTDTVAADTANHAAH